MTNVKKIVVFGAVLLVLVGIGIFHARPVHAASGRNVTAQVAQTGDRAGRRRPANGSAQLLRGSNRILHQEWGRRTLAAHG